MTEQQLRTLAGHRVQDSPYLTQGYKVKNMTPEERVERRMFMRKCLKNTSYNNISNDELDMMRIEILPAEGLYIEDVDGSKCVIPNGVNSSLAAYRKGLARIPKEYENMVAMHFNFKLYGCDTKDMKQMVNDFLIHFKEHEAEGYGLYIHSKTKGTGKTMLACIILNELSIRYMAVTKFITIYDYLELTKKSYNDKGMDINAINNTQVLVIDDIGAHMNKEWIDTVLFNLIDKRTSNKLVTIYTSNLAMDKLSIGDRAISRIKEKSFIINIPEVSIRDMQTNKKHDEFRSKLKKSPI